MRGIVMGLFSLFKNGNGQDKINQSLKKAVMKNKADKVKEALDKGAHPGLLDKNGNTLLHFSAYIGNYEISKMLIDAAREKGAEILSHVNQQGKTPLDMVMDSKEEGQYTKIVALLRLEGAGWKLPDIYMSRNDDNAVDYVINSALSNELLEAAVELDIDYAKRLLSIGADPNPNINLKFATSPIVLVMGLAAEEGLSDEIRDMAVFLVDHDAKLDWEFQISPEFPGKTNLIRMAKNTDMPEDVADFIGSLYHKQLANEQLKDAAYEGDVESGKKALNSGASINARYDLYATALHFALSEGHGDFVKMLLEKNPEVDVKDSQGSTLLHVAVIPKDVEMLNLVMGAYQMNGIELDVDVRDNLGSTPLHNAIREDNYDVIQTLLAMGADINAENNAGYVPLSIAVLQNDAEMAGLLVGLGAEISDQVIAYAKEIGANEAAKTLVEWRRTGEVPEIKRRPEVEKVEGKVVYVKFGKEE